jgi:hypothetical protein
MVGYGLGCFTEASLTSFFNEKDLETVSVFLSQYPFATNNLGYSKRVLGGILFRGVHIGRVHSMDTGEFDRCIDYLIDQVRTQFSDQKLELFSLEFTNQALAHKSSWHKDLEDGKPYLNVFVTLDAVDETNGMTTLRTDDGRVIGMKAAANRWYSFDGSITHCAGAASKPGTPRRILIAVFRRSGDPEPVLAAATTYKAILTRRSQATKRSRPPLDVPASSRALRSRN